jgi:hypothetical protein
MPDVSDEAEDAPTFLGPHMGAELPGDRVVMFGMMRGHWTREGIPVSEPCGHGPMVEEATA